MIDGRNIDRKLFNKMIVSHLCDRHFGIGADGLIVLSDEVDYDYRMDYYNADGLPGSMCGNGGRCSAAFARELNIIRNKGRFLASDGEHEAVIHENDGTISLSLRDVQEVRKLNDSFFMDTGSPHRVIFVEDVAKTDVYNEGRTLRYDKQFPDGANINFVEFAENHIKVRTYERGVENETLSCGTGITASAIAAYMMNKENGTNISIQAPGGDLKVSFKAGESANFTDLILTGPAVKVFEGEIEI
jgi:diaminopimelate epimerase